ncbi:threonine ammonia-lyase [Halobacteriales archaeon SW_7_68_16]|nr:MAG: threonine ammonia-lyase [Halobacteriales archaeon SW_7_68_16]
MIDIEDVLAAEPRVAETARETPLDYSYTYSDMTGAAVYLKLENHQRTGSFKIRGATNRIATLPETERAAGVVTASAGNHAQGVALAASRAGVDSTVVMPEYAPVSKVTATRSYGAEVVLHGVDYDAAQARAREIEAERGLTYVHAFDDDAVIAGQGTLGLEIHDQSPDLDTIVVPIGGGGLIAGVATAITARNPDARVIGVQAEGASSAAPSLQKGEIHELESVDTIADGIATRRIGDRPFEIIRERVDEVVTVSDPEIAMAVTLLLERSKTLVEGAGAVALAALLADTFEYDPDERVVLALCGGNIDLNVLRTIIVRGLVRSGRYLRVATVLNDQPGALADFLNLVAAADANVASIQHDRTTDEVGMNTAEVHLDIETHGPDHVDELLDALRERFPVEVLAGPTTVF